MHDENLLVGADQPDGCKILAWIVTWVGVEAGRDAEHAGMADHQRVAIGRRLGDSTGTQRAAGAGPVLDHELLTERRAHALGEQPRQHVVAAARRKRHDNDHGTGRIDLRARWRGGADSE